MQELEAYAVEAVGNVLAAVCAVSYAFGDQRLTDRTWSCRGAILAIACALAVVIQVRRVDVEAGA
jgi:steroid 5-alpha reductase family enzyme